MIFRKILKLDKYILEFLIDLFRDFFFILFLWLSIIWLGFLRQIMQQLKLKYCCISKFEKYVICKVNLKLYIWVELDIKV